MIAISLLEKLLFPQDSLKYSKELVFKGFTTVEKKRLGCILSKIDPQFELNEWLLSWSLNTTNLGTAFFAEIKDQRSAVIKLNSMDVEPNHSKKTSRWCCC